MAITSTENPDEFTAEQRSEIDAAWRNWQSAESRDRGYDFEACRRLRGRYYALVNHARETNAETT